MAILYDYCGNNGRCNNNIKICLKENSGHDFILRFNSVYKTQIPENDLVYAEFFNSILKYLIKGNCTDIEIMDRSRLKTAYDGYQDFLTQIRYDNIISRIDFELPEALFNGPNLNKCFLFDPVSFAHKIEPSKVLMINSRIDHYFSKKSINMLWGALGRSEIHWLNRMHRSPVLNSKKVLRFIRHFIGEN